jgi:hypothetical protein
MGFTTVGKQQLGAQGTWHRLIQCLGLNHEMVSPAGLLLVNFIVLALSARVNQFQEYFCTIMLIFISLDRDILILS